MLSLSQLARNILQSEICEHAWKDRQYRGPHLPGVFTTVVIEELPGPCWPQGLDQGISIATLSAGVNVACRPPMSVCTQPGLTTTHVMPSGARSLARLRMTMFTAAFELR